MEAREPEEVLRVNWRKLLAACAGGAVLAAGGAALECVATRGANGDATGGAYQPCSRHRASRAVDDVQETLLAERRV